MGVARLCRELGVPCLALAGTIGDGAPALLLQGIDAYFSICHKPMALEMAVGQAESLLSAATEQVVRGFLSGRRRS